MKAVLILVAALAATFAFAGKAYALETGSGITGSVGIAITDGGNVEVITQLGNLACTHGNVSLESPNLRFPTDDNPKSKLIEIYGNGKSNHPGDAVATVIGPYTAGTKLVFAIDPLSSICKGQHLLSTDLLHARIVKLGENFWKIIWEDLRDRDFDDLYTFVRVIPEPMRLGEQIKAARAFSKDPHYGFPWRMDNIHQVSQVPGEGSHWNANAYDFSGQFDVYAPEDGLVLWVEDSFGIGGDKPSLNAQVNVVVLKTSPDTQVTLVHLATGSVHSLGINIGDVVEKGQKIGRTDLTGYATGIHLHMEFQTACHTLQHNLDTWTEIVKGKRSRTHLDWNCPTKSFYSDGFWSGETFYSELTVGHSYQNNP